MAKDKPVDAAPSSRLSLRIDLPNGSRVGPGKVSLLEAIARCASISAAAREQGLSYRRAWLLIDDMNRAFRETVVETYPGRSQGKGAALTPSKGLSMSTSMPNSCFQYIARDYTNVIYS